MKTPVLWFSHHIKAMLILQASVSFSARSVSAMTIGGVISICRGRFGRICQWSHVLGMGHDLRHRQTNVIGARTQRPQVLIQSKLLRAASNWPFFNLSGYTPWIFSVLHYLNSDARSLLSRPQRRISKCNNWNLGIFILHNPVLSDQSSKCQTNKLKNDSWLLFIRSDCGFLWK